MCEKLDSFAYEGREKKEVIRQYARSSSVLARLDQAADPCTIHSG